MSVQVIIVAIGFALMGIAAFVRPRTLTASLDIVANTPSARNEIQAVYGGFGIAIAVVLFLAQSSPQHRQGVILTVAVALAGMAAGRLVAALRERPGRWPVVFFIVEAGAAALLYSAL